MQTNTYENQHPVGYELIPEINKEIEYLQQGWLWSESTTKQIGKFGLGAAEPGPIRVSWRRWFWGSQMTTTAAWTHDNFSQFFGGILF